jgi:flagellar hook-associated protein 3 FlgL
MSIDRIGTAANAQVVLAQLQRADHQLNESNRQVASGKVSDTYSGYGAKTAALEAARAASDRADANVIVAQQALTRLDLQDTQLSKLGDLVNEVRKAVTQASATNDGSGLMGQVQDLFDQAVAILNSRDGSGFVYGGERNQTAPVTISTLDELAALPSAASAFANGSVENSLRIGENRTVKVGVLASDAATELFGLLRDITLQSQGTPFTLNMDAAQQSFLQTSIQSSITAGQNLNSIIAANGQRYSMVQNAIMELQTTSTVYKGFVSNIEDVDMAQAISRLNQDQIALQASLKVSANLSRLTLLDYME